MTFNKIIAISGLAFLLAACDPMQMQKEGSVPAVKPAAGVSHQHQLPNGSFVTHKHVNGGDTSHTHTMAEVKKALQMQ